MISVLMLSISTHQLFRFEYHEDHSLPIEVRRNRPAHVASNCRTAENPLDHRTQLLKELQETRLE